MADFPDLPPKIGHLFLVGGCVAPPLHPASEPNGFAVTGGPGSGAGPTFGGIGARLGLPVVGSNALGLLGICASLIMKGRKQCKT